MENNSQKNFFDWYLLFIIFLFMIISCIFIYSSQKYLPYTGNFALKQMVWYISGLFISSAVFLFDFDQIKKLSLFAYLFGVLLLVGIIVGPESIVPETKGVHSWYSLKGTSFSIQPSEFMKVFLIVFLARLISDHNKKHINRSIKSDSLLICKIFSATLVPLVLVILQPDAGTAMVITCIMIGMLFLSGISWRFVLSFSLLGAVILSFLVYIYTRQPDLLLLVLDQFQLDRIHSWLDPFKFRSDIGYQLSQSILAIGSGTLYGKGYNSGQVIVPEAHSDFIFTTISEEYGFLGGAIVIVLYFLLIYRIIAIGLQNRGDYENLIAAGVVSMLTFHIFENIGMVIGLLPMTGIPLPLLSYGGSSIMGVLLALSLILNISAKTKHYMFESDLENTIQK